jgi:hypothetical protein
MMFWEPVAKNGVLDEEFAAPYFILKMLEL